MRIIIVLDHIYKLYTHVTVRNPRPQSDRNWDNRRGWLRREDHMCSRSVNALLRCFIKRSTLITSSFPWGPAANGLVGQKMLCKFLIASTYDYIRNTCLCLLSTWMLYHYYLQCLCLDYYMSYLIHAAPVHPSLCLQYFNPAVYCNFYCYLYFTAVVISLLLLS
jgi:hypothetical protein